MNLMHGLFKTGEKRILPFETVGVNNFLAEWALKFRK